MKKATKIWLVIATALVVVGGLIYGGIMAVLNWDFTKLSTSDFKTTKHEITEHFENISINVATADIQFLPSDSAKTLVVCHEQEHLKYAVAVADNTLKITREDTRKWYEHIGITFDTHKVTVYLPEAEYGSLHIKASTGEITVPNTCFFEDIDITASTGTVKNYASASGSIRIKASTGNIIAKNISAASLDLSVSTGKITIEDASCHGTVKTKVSTGDAMLSDIQCGSLTSTATTGDLILKSVVATEDFSIKCDTGDVKLDACDAASIEIETSTGDIKGTLLSEKVFIVKTDTGKINIPETVTGGKCKITTDTGDIQIKLQS